MEHQWLQRADGTPGVVLHGSDLRFCLMTLLHDRGPCRISELRMLLERDGLCVAGSSPDKAISDALRYECGKGRVWRLERGRYGVLLRPERTVRRHRARHRSLVAEVARRRIRRD